MKKIILLGLLILMAGLLLANDLTYSGTLRTRGVFYNTLNDGIAMKDESKSASYIDSRLQTEFVNTFNDMLKAVWKIQVGADYGTGSGTGYVTWGDTGQGGGIDTRGFNLQTVDLYIDYACPKTQFDWKVGLQWWADHRSLVWDDDFAAIMGTRTFNDRYTVEVGTAKLNEGIHTEYDDQDLYILNLTTENWGIQNLMRITARDTSNAVINQKDFWIMPWATQKVGAFNLDFMGALNFGSDVNDVKNSGYAVAFKGTWENKIKLTADVLMTSGDDGTDPKSTTEFKTISEWYMNGLSIFGRGYYEDKHPGWVNSGNNAAGLLSIVGSIEYPLCCGDKIMATIGSVSATEEGARQGTNMGTEFDLGYQTKLTECMDVNITGAYAIPGDFFKTSTEDLDSLYKISGVLQYNF